MNDEGVVDHRVSEILAEVLGGAKIDSSASQDGGEFTLESGKSEEAYSSSRLELDEHINVALRPEIRTQY